MADRTIFFWPLTNTTNSQNKYLGLHDATNSITRKLDLQTVLSAGEHVVDPTLITNSSSTNVQRVLEDLDVAINGASYTHPDHTGDVPSVGDGAQTISNNAVTTPKIADSNVTLAKLADVAGYSFLGRSALGTGTPNAFTPGSLTPDTPDAADLIVFADITGFIPRHRNSFVAFLVDFMRGGF